jgi:single-strand DNA-binding protein
MPLASITIIGNLGADPETSVSQSGSEFTKFRVAVSSYDKKNTTWFRVTCMGKQGEIAQEYLKKGNPVCVIGDFQMQEYETRDGETRTSAEVFCKTLTLVSQKAQDDDDDRPRRSANPAARAASGGSARKARPFGDDDDDDEVPL